MSDFIIREFYEAMDGINLNAYGNSTQRGKSILSARIQK